jgi:predicted phage terminase large subunit-like protein
MSTLIDWNGRKLDATGQLEAFDRFECEESLATFLERGWQFVDPAPFNRGWVIDALADHLEAVVDGEISRLMIHIPPRCSKSSICSVAFPAWVWLQPVDSPTSGPSVPIVSGSYAFKLSVRDSIKCRRLIKSPWYQRLWGDRVKISPDNDQKIRFGNTAGGERLVTSVDGGVTGEGGQIIIIDDPNNAKEVLSDAVIETTNEDWWDGTMSTRLNDPKTGAFIVIQQRLGESDLSGHIMRKDEWPNWTHLCLPMEYESRRSFVTSIGWKDPRTEEGELLWPERFGHKEVSIIKGNLGSWRTAGQLQQRPEPAGGGIIKRKHWVLWPPEGEEMDNVGQPLRPAAYPPMDFILASLDTAYTTDNMNDPSALTIWGVFSGDVVARDIKYGGLGQSHRVFGEATQRVMLMYAWSGRMELHDLVNHVARLCGRKAPGLHVDKLMIEAKASGISVAQELRRLFAHEGFGIQLNDPGRVDKVARLYSVQNIFEEGAVYAPDRSWAEEVIAQCGTFPNAEHDDFVDTVSQALRHLRDIGMLTRSAERMADLDDGLNALSRQRLAPLYPG